ncbi:MAG: hypothetical protein H6739_16645 [Alphaproteobacteria bacterium]|nr:hypothetical protein [Alphaproteobacteria bacterium]
MEMRSGGQALRRIGRTHGVLVLLCAPTLLAATPFDLPPDEPLRAWARPLSDQDFVPGAAGGPGPWVRVVPATDGTWTIEVLDEAGELRRYRGHAPPRGEAGRRDLVNYARTVLRPDDPLPALVLPASPPPAPAAAPAPKPGPKPEPAPKPEPEPPVPSSWMSVQLRDQIKNTDYGNLEVDGLFPQDPTRICICRVQTRGDDGASAEAVVMRFGDDCSCSAVSITRVGSDDDLILLPRDNWR